MLPGGSCYFTCIQNTKLVTTKFKSGGLHEKHVVATWNLGNHLTKYVHMCVCVCACALSYFLLYLCAIFICRHHSCGHWFYANSQLVHGCTLGVIHHFSMTICEWRDADTGNLQAVSGIFLPTCHFVQRTAAPPHCFCFSSEFVFFSTNMSSSSSCS